MVVSSSSMESGTFLWKNGGTQCYWLGRTGPSVCTLTACIPPGEDVRMVGPETAFTSLWRLESGVDGSVIPAHGHLEKFHSWKVELARCLVLQVFEVTNSNSKKLSLSSCCASQSCLHVEVAWRWCRQRFWGAWLNYRSHPTKWAMHVFVSVNLWPLSDHGCTV